MIMRFTIKKTDAIIIAILFIVTVGVRLYDLNGAGGTFDEYNYFRLAANTAEAFKHLDFSEQRWSFFSEHPPIGKYIHALFYYPSLSKLSQQDTDALIHGYLQPNTISGQAYNPARYASVLMGGLTIVIVYLFCMLFLNRSTGIIAGGILAFLPNFIAYHKIASLEAPSSFFYTMAVLFFALAIKYDNWKWWKILGVVTGLAIATKFNTALVLPFYIVMFLIWKGPGIWHSTRAIYHKTRDSSAAAKHAFKELWYWKLFFVPVIAFLVVYLVWPWLWSAPFARLAQGNSIWNGGLGVEPWFGSMLGAETNHLYFFTYFLYTTPLLILFLFVISLHHQYKHKSFWNSFVLFWFLVPLVLWSFQPVKHDGMRTLTMIYPPLAILAAQGLEHLLKTPKKILYGAAVLLIYLIALSAWIHPYYLDYYNSLIGGPKKVADGNLLEFDWYAEGKREAVQWFNDNAELGAEIGAKWNPDHDFGGFRSDLKPYNLIGKQYSGEPLYYMINHRYYQYDLTDPVKVNLDHYRLVYTIKAGNGDLGWIYKRKV